MLTKKYNETIADTYPDLFYIKDGDLYFKEYMISRKPLYASIDLMSGECNIDVLPGIIETDDDISLWISADKKNGLLVMEKHKDIYDNMMIVLDGYGIDVQYRDAITQRFMSYDMTAIRRRHTINDIMES